MSKHTKYPTTALLLTEDPALENAARDVSNALGDVLRHFQDGRDATCLAFDCFDGETIAIVDVDAPAGTRAIVNTIAGMVPVIAVSTNPKPWLQTMLRRRRIRATFSKPVCPEALKQIVYRIRDMHGNRGGEI